jgi:hypothetical protein
MGHRPMGEDIATSEAQPRIGRRIDPRMGRQMGRRFV